MTTQINSNYLEKYAEEFALKVCDRFFANRQFITGQDIVQLTPSLQVNLFIIKRLFELWQEELGKLKSSPFFDYRDIAVHEALTQFMNVLSRRIKMERNYLAPILEEAVMHSIQVATDPVNFFHQELQKAPAGKLNDFLKENKKYYKWNEVLISSLIDKTGLGHDLDSYQRAISSIVQANPLVVEDPKNLLSSLDEELSFDLESYWGTSATSSTQEEVSSPQAVEEEFTMIEEEEIIIIEEEIILESETSIETPSDSQERKGPASQGRLLDAAHLKNVFSNESYKGMKGILGDLSESLALNQRFMFTKELFDGNADLLRHALKSVDEVNSFDEAVDLINSRFVLELNWDIDSEEVREFMQQIFRKFLE